MTHQLPVAAMSTSHSAVNDRANRDATIRRNLLAFRDVLDLNLREVIALGEPTHASIQRVAYLDGEQVTAIITAILNEGEYAVNDTVIDGAGVKRRHALVCNGAAIGSVGVLEFAFGDGEAVTANVASKVESTAIIDSDKIALSDVAIRVNSDRNSVEYLLHVTCSRAHWTSEIAQAMRFASAKDAIDFVWHTWENVKPPDYTLETMLPADVYAIHDDADWSEVLEMMGTSRAQFAYHNCSAKSFGIDDVVAVRARHENHVDGGHERDSSGDHIIVHGLFLLKDSRWILVYGRSGGHNTWENGTVRADVCDSWFTATSHEVMDTTTRAALKMPRLCLEGAV